MAANMYRVGDYVFFETSSTSPFQIRRIEELNKTPNGNVEAKVMCFYRRREISGSLIMLADKHQSALEEEQEEEPDVLNEKQRHQLKHRELFLSRQIETLPATHIRGKCTVTLLNETESLLSYLNKDDTFFYSLVYDPQQKTLLADKGEIRVGTRYQADIPPLLADTNDDDRNLEELEILSYTPHHELTDRQIDQFLVVARSVGTFARALDCSSSIKQPSLHMSAAAASRDVTLFHAMDVLFQHKYDIASAISSLVPPGGPVLCRDEMEEWSASEANLFEEALEKYGKDFTDIRQDFLPWKSLKNLIEYYYMWKTTDRYVQQKRVKAVEAESKLKQVYIPNYNKPNPAAIHNNKSGMMNGMNGTDSHSPSDRPCESCYSNSSSQWYAWGPAHMLCRLCNTCWTYWKKYGGLKLPTRIVEAEKLIPPAVNKNGEPQYPCKECNKVFFRQERLTAHMAGHRPHRCTIGNCGKEFKLKAHLARHCANAHGLAIRAGSPRPIMKTRAAFYLSTTSLTKQARRASRDILRPRHAARNPFLPISMANMKQEYDRLVATESAITPFKIRRRLTSKVNDVSHRLGTVKEPSSPEWLKLKQCSNKQPEHLAFEPPPRGSDGKSLYDPVAKKLEDERECTIQSLSFGIHTILPSILPKRIYESLNGGSPHKRLKMLQHVGDTSAPIRSTQILNHLNGGRNKVTIGRPGRKQMMSWFDAPDDVYFIANDATRKLRRELSWRELRHIARQPLKVYGDVYKNYT